MLHTSPCKEERQVDDQQQSRQLLWTIGIVVAIVGACIFLQSAYVHEWKWTGLVKNPNFHKRTLWDWLNLLIVPAVLALGGYLFTRSESQRSQETAEKERTVDREIADERRQDDMLQAYLDGMSQLLTDKERPLHRAELGDYLSTMARARTTRVLQRLKGERKGSVVQFLYESGLITTTHTVLTLRGADLGDANLIRANLIRADLSGTNLREANLSDADLLEAHLRDADLREADLREANLIVALLRGADLSEAYLIRADLQGKADLSGALLLGALLLGANLSEADLSEADLNGTNLREANLREANLIYAVLSAADLGGAALNGAEEVTNEQLRAASSLEGATMPDGQTLRGDKMPDGPTFEDWLKDRESRKEDGENNGSS